jgi:hypothetical protein
VDEFGAGGGSLALAELIDEHGTALVADFQAHYGLQLSAVLFERSPREVLALVEGLVAYEDSLYVAHELGGEAWQEFLGWGKGRHMTADLWDATAKLIHVSAGDRKNPKPYPRPNLKQSQQGIPFLQVFGRSKGD